MGKVADPLRDYVRGMRGTGFMPYGSFRLVSIETLMSIADRIDADHEGRMERCRRETKRAFGRYLRSVIVDYEHSMKRRRADMLARYERRRRDGR